MTFRPSDDVLEELADSQNSQSWTYNNGYNNVYTGASNQWIWQQGFSNWWIDGYGVVWNEWTNPIIDLPVEEVKAPDLSELLMQNSLTDENMDDKVSLSDGQNTISDINAVVPPVNSWSMNNQWQVSFTEVAVSVPEQQVSTLEQQENISKQQVNSSEQTAEQIQQVAQNNVLFIEGQMTDAERYQLVSWIEWFISWSLDFLVDKEWSVAIGKYKKIHRLLFKWGLFIVTAVIGIVVWAFMERKNDQYVDLGIVRDSTIQDRVKWVQNTSDKILSPLVSSWVDIQVKIPYGVAYTNWTQFWSKSNLISYKWIVLPQTVSIRLDGDDFISLESFEKQEISRSDLEKLMKYLVVDPVNASLINSFLTPDWEWNRFHWSLIDGFNLWCFDQIKVSNIVCDYFVSTFYRFGKYYDLLYYSDDILTLMKYLKSQQKDIDPVCDMIIEYTQHSWVNTSNALSLAMDYCSEESRIYYKNLVNFINIERSLLQPDLSDEVFDDPDLNAYKLLSAQKIIYKILHGTTLNENYIQSYLKFVQHLLNKDNGTNRYLSPIYKDLIYLFNNDELYKTLLKDRKLSSQIKWQIDQINNWNPLYKYPSLLSQLTTKDLEQSIWDPGEVELGETTIDDIFSQYYYMTDRLKIRKVSKISEDKLNVQTELFTNKILSVTDGETLKLTVSLYRSGNVLYVSSVKIANQPKLTNVVNIALWNWNVSFNTMFTYIDEQIWLWYQDPSELEEEVPTFCDEIQERWDISVYACDESNILLYKWDVEYNFILVNDILDTFTIGDGNLNELVHDKLNWVMFMKENTPTIIVSIIDFTIEEKEDDTLEKKLDVVNQFRIHFKLIPDDIRNVEWDENVFLVDLTLWEFKLQAYYNVDTHVLSKISYVACGDTLEIRWLTLPVTTENEPQLVEIMNNPRVFLTQSNPAAYRKYQRMCDVVEKKQEQDNEEIIEN